MKVFGRSARTGILIAFEASSVNGTGKNAISSRTDVTLLDKATHNGIAIHILESRSEMGARAASDIAREIRTCLQRQPGLRMIFAAAPSQSEMLSALREEKDIDWSRITAFHMDEYLDLPASSPQRFGSWLCKMIFDHLPFAAVHLLEPGDNPAADRFRVCG